MSIDYSVCNSGSSCKHPNQGNLTHLDYHKCRRHDRGRIYKCKACINDRNNKKREREYHTCEKGSECKNPRQYNLTPNDYYGTIYKRKSCKMCYTKRVTIRKRKRPSFEIYDVVNSSLTQQFICGVVGYEVQKQRL